MKSPAPFEFRDCALITLSAGRGAQNLRELRDGIATVPATSLHHHFYQTLMRPTFDDPEYRNDFSLWARRQLHDSFLAERLDVLDPLALPDTEALRQALLDIIEDRLAELPYVPAASPGHELHFLSSQVVVLPTGQSAATPQDMGRAIAGLPTGSIFFHFIEARLREPRGVDDFSAWLALWGDGQEPALKRLMAIDYSLWSLVEMRARIARCLEAVEPAGARS